MNTVLKILILVVLLVAAHSQTQFQLCWKRTYILEWGAGPPKCSSNDENIDGNCYSLCPWGYTKFGQQECRQNCPSFSKDNGDGTCSIQQKYSNPPFQPSNPTEPISTTFNRCISSYGNGNCQTIGTKVFPNCAPQYSTTDGYLCSFNGNCPANGMDQVSRLVCRKKSPIPVKINPLVCGPNEQYYIGYCYLFCKSGYIQIGPVCWQVSPKGWFDKGFSSINQADYSTFVGPLTKLGIKAAEAAIIGQKALVDYRSNSSLLPSRLAAMKANFKIIKDKYTPLADQVIFFAKGNANIKSSLINDISTAFIQDTSNYNIEDYVWKIAMLVHMLNPINTYNNYFMLGYSLCESLPTSTQSSTVMLKTVMATASAASNAAVTSPAPQITAWTGSDTTSDVPFIDPSVSQVTPPAQSTPTATQPAAAVQKVATSTVMLTSSAPSSSSAPSTSAPSSSLTTDTSGDALIDPSLWP